MLFIDVEVKRVVGVGGVMRVALLRLGPGDDFTHIFDKGFALGDILQRKHAFAVHAGAAGLNAPTRAGGCFFGHG